MFLKANGNIGIGIDNPNEKLEVVGNIKLYSPNSDIVTVGHDGVNGFIESGTAVNGALKINFNSGENVEVLTNSTGGSFEVGHNVFLSTIDGSVGIGTKTIQQGYKLVVDGGKVGFREVYVKLLGQWPDYVFAQNYKLKPLADVEEFITNNKHLPDMPNASMIEIEGQNIGEIQRLHQLKIEEIFLYIIQLQKEIEYLKNCR